MLSLHETERERLRAIVDVECVESDGLGAVRYLSQATDTIVDSR